VSFYRIHISILDCFLDKISEIASLAVLDLPPGAWIWPCPQAHHLKFGFCEIVCKDSLLTYLTCRPVRSSQRHHVEHLAN
jgi:hypothetical protein